MISFNIPLFMGEEEKYIKQVFTNKKLCGDGEFTKKSSKLIEDITGTKKALLSTSCTHALEMAALLCEIEPGDEVIMPSYTFVSTANAFVLRGARIVFVDIRPDTMNIDENLIEDAVTEKTKVIVVVHYAGVACEMDKIMKIAGKHHLLVVEDAAQAIGCSYSVRGGTSKSLGTIGDYGCYSFHETKNITCGEGGALLIQDIDNVERAEIIREKGTNRSKFYRGEIDKYSWMDKGSSYLPSELNAAYLYAQLESLSNINTDRRKNWSQYYNQLVNLQKQELIALPEIPEGCVHNGHMFWLKVRDLEERTRFINYLRERGISAVFHYIPLHSSVAGKAWGRFHGEDVYTTRESERLVRLPMYYGLTEQEVEYVVQSVVSFWK